MAKAVKNLTKNTLPAVTTLKTDEGTYTKAGEETCKEIMTKHFPTHTDYREGVYTTNKIKTSAVTTTSYKSWITRQNVRRVLLKFKAKKSPGPDKFKPIIFKYLPNNILDIITLIYKACLALHDTPKAWKESNVIFIPKQGKKSYQLAKSYRPISLSNYLLKGMEKLVVEQVDIALESHPLHKNQHGFQKGKSTESAILQTVNYIEKHINNGKDVLGVF